MKLSELKKISAEMDEVRFILPDGSYVPEHFHLTEVRKIDKHFVDCGGTVRKESVINFQLWTAEDYDHRLGAEKLKSIIGLSEKHLDLEDAEIEVEYQGDTIGKYGLDFQGSNFQLTAKQTDCLVKDNCGVPEAKPKINLAEIESSGCTTGGVCC